jgi:hypothetical protein
MNKAFKIPPKSADSLSPMKVIAERLSCLIGTAFLLTGKTRTDGSNIRKLVATTLEKFPLIDAAQDEGFERVPPKGKGIPKITREFIDTYIVTSGTTYNLQVWNRIPASKTLLIRFDEGRNLKCADVRFVFVRVDVVLNRIASIIILTPEYIESRFGRFGKPTIKYQLLISSKARKEIFESEDKILCFQDSTKLSYFLRDDFEPPKVNMTNDPTLNEIYSIEVIKQHVAKKLVGLKLKSAATKNRGQALEQMVLDLLGYPNDNSGMLYGAFPDIRNQLLEVKVQDSQTVDLGKYSPEIEEIIVEEYKITTHDVRYLIALTNPETEIIEGVILMPGEKLGDIFSYVSDKSYKCQRSIPMGFFDQYSGKVVFNPD